MGAAKKIIIGTIVVGAIAGGVVYASRLNKMSEELVVVPTVRVHKIAADGITIRVDARLKNPTRSRVKIKFPFVKLYYKDSVIGSSQAVDKDIEIPSYGEAVVEAMMVNIPFLGLFSLAGDLMKSLQDGTGVKVGVKTMSVINLGWKKVPYEDFQEYTLKTQTTEKE
jgi:hypothetical protein